uniref:DNA-directed primase/polymerase protein isoform X2 n=1 Tax=Myxine glutinosa TaxID=7769 RepID=UPI00358E84B2
MNGSSVPSIDPHELEERFRARPLNTRYLPHLTELHLPLATWKEFHRLVDALHYELNCGIQGVHVFAYEPEGESVGHSGGRKFVATTYAEFWHYYHPRCACPRTVPYHYYEVIPEESPCNLYLDVEFYYEFNPGKDGPALTSLLIEYICANLVTTFSLPISRRDVLSLDSSSSTKFSRHLIFHLPDAAFRNNRHAGRFLSELLGPVLNDVRVSRNRPSDAKRQADPEALVHSGDDVCLPLGADQDSRECSPVVGTHGGRAGETRQNVVKVVQERGSLEEDDIEIMNTFDDETVDWTSGDRELAREQKGFKEIKTAVTHEPSEKGQEFQAWDEFDEDEVNRLMEQEERTFFSMGSEKSCDNRVSRDCELHVLVVKDRDGKDTLAVDMGVYTRNRNFRLYGSSKRGKDLPLLVSPDNTFVPASVVPGSEERMIFLASLVCNIPVGDHVQLLTCDDEQSFIQTKSPGQPCSNRVRQLEKDEISGFHSSHFPAIDEFIKTQINKGGIVGAIRQWTYNASRGLLVYDIARNRWCENIGRPHRSNHIRIEVNLEERMFYQRCYDPVCRSQNFCSKGYPLPAILHPKQ